MFELVGLHAGNGVCRIEEPCHVAPERPWRKFGKHVYVAFRLSRGVQPFGCVT